ncbi:MAG TPA: ATP-binding protein [Acidimicrobiia bacterium]
MLNITAELAQTEYPLLRFRAAGLRRSVVLAWLVIGALTAVAINKNIVADEPRFLVSIGVFVMVMAGATAANWNKVLLTRTGPWLAWAWTIALTLALASIAAIPAMFSSVLPVFSGVVVLTGLVLPPLRHIFVSILAVFLLVLTAVASPDAGVEEVSIQALTVAVVAGATALIGTEFEREAKRGAERLRDLQEQRADFERLYAVSATLASAESLTEGLPQIVGTICTYLDAQIGVVFLYQPDDHSLKIMSPMWVNGHTLDVGDLKIRVTNGGIIPQVFRSGKAIHLEDIESNPDKFGVVGELGMSEALIAPLRVEGFNVGVIAVGDPTAGSFEPEQISDLASLAAPAALVLSQLGRYEAAAEMTKRMQEVAQMKTDFVSVVSHELRTPLTSIIGSLDTVVRPELSKEASHDLIDSARRQAGRLQRLIEDLLMVSRIDRQSVPVAPEHIKLLTYLHDVTDTVSLDNLTISVEPSDLVISADPDHLGRVFINLVENARKYAPGSPVEIVARAVRSRVDIDVVDHGEGISLDQQSRIFDRFTQIERSDTRTRGGTGLGLSIVKGLVEAMGGQVAVGDTPGGGATFTVSLPPATVDEEFSPRSF